MNTDKLERRLKKLYKNVKSGRVTEEIADEIADAIESFEDLGEEAKDRFGDIVDEMKSVISKNSRY